MSQPYIGQILAVAFNFAPNGWLACNGQTLSIAEYDTLFSLIGTTYGGDGQSTFMLPNLNGRAALCEGQGAGLAPSTVGAQLGTESVTLTAAQNGAHTHLSRVTSQVGTTAIPGNQLYLAQSNLTDAYAYGPPSGTPATMSSWSIGAAGGSRPHENRQPFLAITYVIAVSGVYPSKS